MEDKDLEDVTPAGAAKEDEEVPKEADESPKVVEVSPPEKKKGADYQEALKDLNNIALSGKRILEEDSVSGVSSKRIRSEEAEKDESTAQKMEAEEDEEVKELPLKEDLVVPLGVPSSEELEGMKREFKRLSRSELENLVLQKMVAFLFCESEIGALRQKCDYFDEMNERGKKKVRALQKQCQDLNTVMQRYIKDVSVSGSKERVTPVRVTRSVGLQVRLSNKISSSSTEAVPSPKTLVSTSNSSPVPLFQGSTSIKKISNNSSLTVVPVSEGRTPPSTSVKKTPVSTPTSSSSNNKGVIDLVDLSDEEDVPQTKAPSSSTAQARRPAVGTSATPNSSSSVIGRASLVPTSGAVSRPRPGLSMQRSNQVVYLTSHPAPLPPTTLGLVNPKWKWPPPKPSLKISRLRCGIVLSWTLDIKKEHTIVRSYQLFAYQETSTAPSPSLWKKVGDVKALPLPMACTLTQFTKGNKYHFAIRALDSHNRLGPFSDPSSILLS